LNQRNRNAGDGIGRAPDTLRQPLELSNGLSRVGGDRSRSPKPRHQRLGFNQASSDLSPQGRVGSDRAQQINACEHQGGRAGETIGRNGPNAMLDVAWDRHDLIFRPCRA
jgi:hypothetical protein